MAYAQETPPPQTLLDEGVELFKAGKFNETIKVLQEFSQLSPDNYLPYYYIGFSHFRLGDKASAKEFLQKAIELKPDFVPSHMGLAVIYEGEGRLDLAKKEYEAIIAITKEPSEVKIAGDRLNKINIALSAKHIQEAQQLAGGGKFDEAIGELSRAADLTPENIAIQMSLGSLYIHQRKSKEAMEVYNRAKELAPANPEIHMRIAEIYHSTSLYKEAAEEFNEVIKLAPGTEMSLEASKKLKEAEERLKTRGYFEDTAKAIREERFDDALAATQKVLEIEPRNSFVYFNLGVIYNRKKMYDDAETALKRAIEISPKYVEARFQLGVVYDDQGKLDEAIAEYEAAVAIGKEDVEETKKAADRLNLLQELMMAKEAGEKVKIFMNAGDLEGALKEAEKIVAVAKNEKNLSALGQVYLLKKEFDKAIETFDQVIKINPQNWEANLFIAQAYEGKKLYREATTFYSKVAGAVPDTKEGIEARSKLNQLQVKIHFENASEYRKKGDIESALQETQSILELDPDDSTALYNAGVLYYLLEKPDRAIPLLSKAIGKAPDYIQAHLQLALIYEHLRRYAEAEAEFKAILALAKEGKEVDIAKSRLGLLKKEEAFSIRMQAAQELIKKGRFEEALDEAKVIISIAPENYIAYYTAGFIYERLDKLEEAKAAFQKAIEINPGYTTAYFGLARVYEREGLYANARDTYSKTIEIGEGTREAELAAVGLQRLKQWRIQVSMNNNVNNVVSTDGNKSTGTATGYGVSLSYDIHKTRQEGLNLSSLIVQNIYYESQVTAMGYGANIAWNDVFGKEHTYGVSAGYTNYTFDKKPDYKNYRYSVNTNLRPGAIPSSISLRFDYSDNSSFVSKLRDTVQYTLSFSATQNTSEWDSVTGSYSFISYQNKDPIGSNFAYRSNNISLKYTRRLWPAFSAGGGYNLKLINYMNPDSTTFFTQFRRNVFHGASLDMSYRMADKARFSLEGDISQETTNIPALKEEELAELGEILANPIPRLGGWDKSRAVSVSGSMDYRLSEKVNLSVNAGNTWVTTEPGEAGGYRKLSIGAYLSTLF